jgi:predicted PurR-regulated permease PerM
VDPAEDNKALPYLLVAVSIALGWILLPFYGTLLWGAIIALLFAPVFHWLLPRLNQRRTASAFLTLFLAIVIVILPLVLVSIAIANEMFQVYERLRSGEWRPALYLHGVFEQLPASLLAVLERFGMDDFKSLQERLTGALTEGSQFIATRLLSVGQNTFEFLLGLSAGAGLQERTGWQIRDGDQGDSER